jgi:two-component system, OmpR family, sensor histidine kinase KdpD
MNDSSAPSLPAGLLRWLVLTALPVLIALALNALGASATTAGFILLVLVVWSATGVDPRLSLYIAALCALLFDYFFLPPYHTLWLEGPQQWIDMLAFFVSGLVVGRLAEKAKRQMRQVQQRQAEVERLYALSQEMMLYEDADRLVRDLPRVIDRTFALEGVVLYISDHDQVYASRTDTPMGLKANMQAVARGLNPTPTSFAGYQTTALMLGLRPIGALAWQPESLSRAVSAAVNAQIAIAVSRAIAIESSAHVEAVREAERLREALIDSLTHELRTPLTSIRAAATTLLETGHIDEAARQDLVVIIDEEAARLDLLIGQAVEMAEIDAKVIAVHRSPHHPRELLDQAVEQLRPALQAHKVSIRIQGQDGSAPSAPPDDKPVWFDPHLLGRVLHHLLENAAAYTPPGSSVTLSSRRIGDRLEFSVEDDGPGLDAVDLPLIFEKFYRGKRGERSRKGSGMGLAIARAILTIHGGGIEASSVPGSGAAFRFWVPLIEKEP